MLSTDQQPPPEPLTRCYCDEESYSSDMLITLLSAARPSRNYIVQEDQDHIVSLLLSVAPLKATVDRLSGNGYHAKVQSFRSPAADSDDDDGREGVDLVPRKLN